MARRHIPYRIVAGPLRLGVLRLVPWRSPTPPGGKEEAGCNPTSLRSNVDTRLRWPQRPLMAWDCESFLGGARSQGTSNLGHRETYNIRIPGSDVDSDGGTLVLDEMCGPSQHQRLGAATSFSRGLGWGSRERLGPIRNEGDRESQWDGRAWREFRTRARRA